VFGVTAERTELDAPSEADLREVAAALNLELTDEAIEDYVEACQRSLELFETVGSLPPADLRPDPDPPVDERDATGSPDDGDDPLNALLRECTVRGSDAGALDGYEAGVKDIVGVAGVPTTCGSAVLSDYVPDHDATVVTRLLEAGADITGKLNMDDMAAAGTGDLGAGGPVRNARDPDRLAGGSSGGSATAVVTGRVDVAIGGDQGGSVRIPASWSGCVGLKPTHGLVPYTGVVGAGHTFDHVGPLARSVSDCALVLDAIAGPDGLDPRQAFIAGDPLAGIDTDRENYAGRSPEAGDISVGVLNEGFGRDESDPATDHTVREALAGFETAGVRVETASVPWHSHGPAIAYAVRFGETAALVRYDGVGRFTRGYYDEGFARAFGDARRERGDQFPPPVVLQLLLGTYVAEEYSGTFYARAQNLRRRLATAYDRALAAHDVLALPTTPFTALRAEPDLDRSAVLERASSMTGNTVPFNITGHPAVSIPCGTADGLPVGLQFVGQRGDDATVLGVARAFEELVGWSLPDAVDHSTGGDA
jgi:amidase